MCATCLSDFFLSVRIVSSAAAGELERRTKNARNENTRNDYVNVRYLEGMSFSSALRPGSQVRLVRALRFASSNLSN